MNSEVFSCSFLPFFPQVFFLLTSFKITIISKSVNDNSLSLLISDLVDLQSHCSALFVKSIY